MCISFSKVYCRLSLLVFGAVVLALLNACTSTPPISPLPPKKISTQQPSTTPRVVPDKTTQVIPDVLRNSTFDALPGWQQDDLRQAWPAFLQSCGVLIKKTMWRDVCAAAFIVDAQDGVAIRNFFENSFVPYQVVNPDGAKDGLVTGYYEPLLRGSRVRQGKYQTPLYRVPDDIVTIDLASVYPELKNMRLRGKLVGNKVVPYLTREQIVASSSLSGKELVWVDDPVEAFFLQVQGSGRVQFSDGSKTVRLAYADQNGHPYKSIGRYLVDLGELKLEQASAQAIAAWVAAHPSRAAEVLNANPSYVFFKEESLTDTEQGPKGALGVALTPERSIAVDAQFINLGAPVFLATTQPNSDRVLQRLMMAQDTGGAIRGAVRADFFWGFASAAGEKAGKMKQRGMMWVLLPKPIPSMPSN